MDRVERHDVLNAMGLAVVLLAMALGLVFGARALFRTINGGLIETDKTTVEANSSTTVGDDGAEATTTTEAVTTTTVPQIHPAAEVTVRVGNGARRPGVAGAGTSILAEAGYATLGAKNAPSVGASIIYFVAGFEADAVQIATLLNVASSQTAPMPADPGIPQDEAEIVIILGADTTVG